MLTLREIKGHSDIVDRLSGSIARQTIANAYLFYGPEGIGKFAFAKAFARAVNCEQGEAVAVPGVDCGLCFSCRKIEAGNHPDVHIIDEGYDAEIKIESVRLLQQEMSLRPYEARYKVFIINDSHNLNSVSANALLKTLEDTPDRSIIVLVTDKPRVMPATIISRCRRENFRALCREDFAVALSGQGFDDVTGNYLAYFCEGRLGSALRLRGADIIREKNSVIDRFLSGSFEESAKREDLRKELTVIVAWFRDVYLAKAGLKNAINEDRGSEVARCAELYGFDDLERIFSALSSSFFYLEQNVNTKLLLANLHACLRRTRLTAAEN